MKLYKNIGLVLSGGGARGAYHIGVWKALKEIGLDGKITAVAGTSVGALNGALFCQGSFAEAEKIWLDVSKRKILLLDSTVIIKNLLTIIAIIKSIRAKDLLNFIRAVSAFGIFSREGLLEMMEESLDPRLLCKSAISLYICAFNVTKSCPEYIRMNTRSASDIRSYLLASSAIPGIFPPVKVKNNLYLDGGLVPLFRNNVPFQPLVDKEKCKLVIAVHLTSKPDLAGRTKYPEVEFIDIYPGKKEFGFASSLKFSGKTSLRLMSAGYNDALEKLRKC